MTPEERLERFAALTVRVGANVQPGQEVVVTAGVEHAPAARAIAREAYRAGARYVHAMYVDSPFRRAVIEWRPEEMLGHTPPHLLAWARTWEETRPAVIQLAGEPDPHLFDDLDPVLVGRSDQKELRAVCLPLATQGKINWAIVSAPNEGWAREVFGEPDVERLWAAVAAAMRLDADDPVAAWERHAAKLKARAAALNELRLDAVRFRGPGTDLTVGLLERSRWKSASSRRRGGSSTSRTSPRRRSSPRPTGAARRAPSAPPTRSSCRGSAPAPPGSRCGSRAGGSSTSAPTAAGRR